VPSQQPTTEPEVDCDRWPLPDLSSRTDHLPFSWRQRQLIWSLWVVWPSDRICGRSWSEVMVADHVGLASAASATRQTLGPNVSSCQQHQRPAVRSL
jgi:hypothetical protein